MRMRLSDLQGWFAQLEKQAPRPVDRNEYDPRHMSEWVVKAHGALHAAFPPEHAVLKLWEAALTGTQEGHIYALANESVGSALIAAFKAGSTLLREGRLGSVWEAVRAEAVTGLLDQATALAEENAVIAAVTLAGAALELHLKHLCQRNQLQGQGPASIASYDAAISATRSDSNRREIYGANDSKQIQVWSALRHESVHRPTLFEGTKPEADRMIEGIRQLVARTSDG